MAYNIDDLFKSNIPEAIDNLNLGGGALDNISPSELGTGEMGNQLSNVGLSQALITVKPGDDIQKALNKLHILGGGRVLLLNGTHNANYDIQLYSAITIEGENADSTFIDFGGTSHQLKGVGSGSYTTGTVSVSNNGTTVTGSGTTWTGNVTAGQYIMLAGVWYPITNVGGNTTLTIGVPFADVALSGATYTAATILSNVHVKSLTVKNSTASSIKFQYVNNLFLYDVTTQASLAGTEIDTCSQISFLECDAIANYTNYIFTNAHFMIHNGSSSIDALSGHGYQIDKMTNAAISACFVLNSASDGMNISNSSNCRIDGVFAENAGSGIELVSSNDNIVFSGLRVESNGSDGVKLTATTDNVFINNAFIKNNTGYGINNVASSNDSLVITGNNFSGNTTAACNDSGTGTVIRGNVGLTDNSTSASPSQLGFFGTSVDGDVTISADTTLSSDKYYSNLTINSGTILDCAGYAIYVSGTLTNAGTIRNNGGNASGSTGGSGAAGASFDAGVAGGNGGVAVASAGSGTGNTGTNGTSVNPSIGSSGAAGGQGGSSGAGNNGGAAGTAGTATAETLNLKDSLYTFPIAFTAGSVVTVNKKLFAEGATSGVSLSSSAGSGGGSAGGYTSGGTSPMINGGGGGAGGSGGIIFIAASTIINTGTISANGGNGANGNNAAQGKAGGGGGGAGGSGGIIILVYENLTDSGSIVASGGTGGSGGTGTEGGNTGASGSSGLSGKIYKINLD